MEAQSCTNYKSLNKQNKVGGYNLIIPHLYKNLLEAKLRKLCAQKSRGFSYNNSLAVKEFVEAEVIEDELVD